MKTFKFYVVIAAIVLAGTSCVEKSDKYKALLAQRDSLELENNLIGTNYTQTLDIVNQVDSGFAEISRGEVQMQKTLKGAEGKTANKKEMILAQMKSIKETLEQNKTKIQELRRLSSLKGNQNSKLAETIKRLQTEMDEKSLLIQTLQDELSKKNIQIEELSTTVTNLNKNIVEQTSVVEEQKSKIKNQDTDMNTVWYCVATTKDLKAAKIISTSGLFQTTKKVMNTEFDKNNFKQVDLRSLSSIPTNSKKPKILSSHPLNSYNLTIGSDKNVTIEITNPSKFWSVSKYLVVQI